MKVKSSLSGPDGGQRNGRDYEQHRGQEAWGGEGRIVLCNHVDPWRLSSIPLMKSGGGSLCRGGSLSVSTDNANATLQAVWMQTPQIKKPPVP